MSPYHLGMVRELRTTTALRLSASWLASENIRQMRAARGEPYQMVKSVTLQQEIDGAILLSEMKPVIERMN